MRYSHVVVPSYFGGRLGKGQPKAVVPGEQIGKHWLCSSMPGQVVVCPERGFGYNVDIHDIS